MALHIAYYASPLDGAWGGVGPAGCRLAGLHVQQLALQTGDAFRVMASGFLARPCDRWVSRLGGAIGLIAPPR